MKLPNFKKAAGFTLIELLIVITVIGVLVVAVLSALNPIEQVNKARDAGRRADSSQILGAIERYYAATQQYPWNKGTFPVGDYKASITDEYLANAAYLGVGICGTPDEGLASIYDHGLGSGGCVDPDSRGTLIASEELKSQFAKRRAFRLNHVIEDELYLIKPFNDPSISVCFIPSSKATRDTWFDTTKGLKYFGLTSGDGAMPYEPTTSTLANCADQFTAGEPTWDAVDQYCFVCIPEE